MVKKHSWFLTINNPTEFELKLLHEASKNTVEHHQTRTVKGEFAAQGTANNVWYAGPDKKGLAYFGFSKETGKSGTPHVHCICIFKRSQTFKKIKELFPRANIQPVRGTFDEALSYARKDGRFFSIAYARMELVREYVATDNKLAQLSLEGDKTILDLQHDVQLLNKKLDLILSLISQKKILNTLSDEDMIQ